MDPFDPQSTRFLTYGQRCINIEALFHFSNFLKPNRASFFRDTNRIAAYFFPWSIYYLDSSSPQESSKDTHILLPGLLRQHNKGGTLLHLDTEQNNTDQFWSTQSSLSGHDWILESTFLMLAAGGNLNAAICGNQENPQPHSLPKELVIKVWKAV